MGKLRKTSFTRPFQCSPGSSLGLSNFFCSTLGAGQCYISSKGSLQSCGSSFERKKNTLQFDGKIFTNFIGRYELLRKYYFSFFNLLNFYNLFDCVFLFEIENLDYVSVRLKRDLFPLNSTGLSRDSVRVLLLKELVLKNDETILFKTR